MVGVGVGVDVGVGLDVDVGVGVGLDVDVGLVGVCLGLSLGAPFRVGYESVDMFDLVFVFFVC